MSANATMLYKTLYNLASKDAERDLFGTNARLAQEAFQRATWDTSVPTIWFEIPLSGPPRFDLHVAHGNVQIHERSPFSPDAMDRHGELLNWYASQPREGGGLALAYDVGDGRIEAPAVHVNVNAAKAFDVEGFFLHAGRPEATALYRNFARRLPQGWHIWYFGVHPGRSGAPIRVDCFVNKSVKRAYAVEPAAFEKDLQRVGFSVDGSMTRCVGAEVAASPFGMELQFDILSDGALGQTMGVSAQFPLSAVSTARPLWEPTGGAAQLMEFAVRSQVADARWRRIRDTMFSTAVQNGNILQALYCIPMFVKLRVRANRLLDAKVYLQAGAVDL